MPKSLEFNTRPIFSKRASCWLNIAAATELPDENSEPMTTLTINGEEAEVAPEVVSALGEALKNSRRLIESRTICLDCITFGILLCGGEIIQDSDKLSKFPYSNINLYRDVSVVEDASDVARVLEPTMLGRIATRGDETILGPSHMVVRLSLDDDLYAQKFGDEYIGITDLASSAFAYGSTTIGSVLSTELVNSESEPLFSYRAPDHNSSLAHPINTKVMITGPPPPR